VNSRLSKCGFPFLSTDVGRAVYKFAAANKMRYKFSSKTQMTRKYYVTGFKERHPELVL
jgi:hypothetical protein